MALSLASAMTAALGRASVRPSFLVTITVGGGNGPFYAYSGAVEWSTQTAAEVYAASVDSVSPVTWKVDPLTRKPAVSQVSVRFASDGWFRNLVINHRLKGKQLTINLGVADVDTSDWPLYFDGQIEKTRENPDGSFDVSVGDPFAFLRDEQISGSYFAQHPLDLIQEFLTDAGCPTALIDSTSLDPDTYTSSISHWNTMRGGRDQYTNGIDISSPTKALDLVAELARMMDGQVIAREDGIMRFVEFDSSAAVAETWAQADIRNLRTIDPGDNVINRVKIDWRLHPDGGFTHVFERNDTDSQSNFAWPGESERILEHIDECKWANAYAELVGTMTAGSPGIGGTFTARSRLVGGMTGARWEGYTGKSGGPAHPAAATVTSTRVAYIQVDDEIIKCDAATPHATFYRIYRDKEGNETILPNDVIYTVAERGALGTTAAAHGATAQLFDATIPVEMAESLIERWSNGIPIIEVEVGLDKYAIQVGDLVALTYDRFSGFGRDGIVNTLKWEVIGKSVDASSSDKHIKFTLALAFDSGAPTPTTGDFILTAREPATGFSGSLENVLLAGTFGAKVLTGLGVSDGGGLDVNLAGGTGEAMGQFAYPADTITLDASTDNYLYLAAATGGFDVASTSIGAGEPTRADDIVPVAKVVTGASTITSITDLRILTNIDASATVEAGTVTADELGSEAVTTAKVADDSINEGQFAMRKTSVSGGLTRNAGFDHWSRG